MADIDPLSADFAARYPESFARVLLRADIEHVNAVLTSLPAETMAAVVARMPGSRIEELLASGQHDPQRWLTEASFEDAVVLLSRIPREQRLSLVNSLPNRERRQQLLRHQQYPAHSVGALVGDIPVRFNAEMPVAEAVVELREIGGDDPGPLVVVDKQGRYRGTLNVWKVLSRRRPTGTVGDYMDRVTAIYPETSIVNAVDNPDWYQHDWLPVIDHRRRVLGAVYRSSLARAAGKQTSESGRPVDFSLHLMRELVYALGHIIDSIFVRRRPS